MVAVTILGTGCRNSILHKEGAAHVAREAVVPITRSLDELTEKLELEKLTNEITLLTEDVRVLVNNLEDTRVESTELIKTARELMASINEITPEIKKLVSNVNSLVEEAKSDLTKGTTESIWIRILPYAVISIAVLIVALIMLSLFKKRKD